MRLQRDTTAFLSLKHSSPAVMSSPIFDVNPYESHPQLTSLEGEVLWEYAKLAQHVRDVSLFFGPLLIKWSEPLLTTRLQLTAETKRLADTPDEKLLSRLRVLERKMGLVLTLVRRVAYLSLQMRTQR
jgi:DASH complex subunit DAD3